MIVDQLSRSFLYRDFERAYQDVTGLPLSLRPIDAFDLPHRGNPCENPFCALMASANATCAACLQHERKVEDVAGLQVRTLACFAGLTDSAVPIRLDGELLGFLHTGQILLRRPGRRIFARAVERLVPRVTAAERTRIEKAYFRTRVLTRDQYASILRLLSIFAQHLAALSNQIVVQQAGSESPQITRAKAFIAEHQAEDLTLSTVARAVSMSAFYFCKMFKHATGLTYTDYLAHIRVDKVKHLLRERGRRVSEAAYAAGFQSLSQFNRVFRRVAGEPPTVYRARAQQTSAA